MKEYEVRNYSSEEKEGILIYDYEQKLWLGETNVPYQITQAYKKFPQNIEIVTVGLNGQPTMIKFKVPKSCVSLRTLSTKQDDSDEDNESLEE